MGHRFWRLEVSYFFVVDAVCGDGFPVHGAPDTVEDHDQGILASLLDGVRRSTRDDAQRTRRDWRRFLATNAHGSFASHHVQDFIEIAVCVFGDRLMQLQQACR